MKCLCEWLFRWDEVIFKGVLCSDTVLLWNRKAVLTITTYNSNVWLVVESRRTGWPVVFRSDFAWNSLLVSKVKSNFNVITFFFTRFETPLKSWIFQASIYAIAKIAFIIARTIASLISHPQFNIWYISSLLHFVMKVERVYNLKIVFVMSHFWVPLILSFKASLSGKFWKGVFIIKTSHLASLWNRGWSELGNFVLPLQAPFETPYVVRLHNVALISPPRPCFVFVHPNRGL